MSVIVASSPIPTRPPFEPASFPSSANPTPLSQPHSSGFWQKSLDSTTPTRGRLSSEISSPPSSPRPGIASRGQETQGRSWCCATPCCVLTEWSRSGRPLECLSGRRWAHRRLHSRSAGLIARSPCCSQTMGELVVALNPVLEPLVSSLIDAPKDSEAPEDAESAMLCFKSDRLALEAWKTQY